MHPARSGRSPRGNTMTTVQPSGSSGVWSIGVKSGQPGSFCGRHRAGLTLASLTIRTGRTDHGADRRGYRPKSSMGIGAKGLLMYAAVRRYEGIIDDDEAARLVRDSFMPQLEKVPGFIAYYWIDAGDGVMASLSVFEDKAGADESVKFAHQWIEDNAPNLFPNPPLVTQGLVVASDTK
jgi:hypothetical protein